MYIYLCCANSGVYLESRLTVLHVRVSVGVVGLPLVVGFFIFILFKNLTTM